MKKYILIPLIFLGVWSYFNHPIVRLNRLYALNLPLLKTEKIVWHEAWDTQGDGKVIGLFKLSAKTAKRLQEHCQQEQFPLTKEEVISNLDYLCTLQHKKEQRSKYLLVLMQKGSIDYLFYRLEIQ
jgi:hypothetical protein